jgi:hypothetical protein
MAMLWRTGTIIQILAGFESPRNLEMLKAHLAVSPANTVS